MLRLQSPLEVWVQILLLTIELSLPQCIHLQTNSSSLHSHLLALVLAEVHSPSLLVQLDQISGQAMLGKMINKSKAASAPHDATFYDRLVHPLHL